LPGATSHCLPGIWRWTEELHRSAVRADAGEGGPDRFAQPFPLQLASWIPSATESHQEELDTAARRWCSIASRSVEVAPNVNTFRCGNKHYCLAFRQQNIQLNSPVRRSIESQTKIYSSRKIPAPLPQCHPFATQGYCSVIPEFDTMGIKSTQATNRRVWEGTWAAM